MKLVKESHSITGEVDGLSEAMDRFNSLHHHEKVEITQIVITNATQKPTNSISQTLLEDSVDVDDVEIDDDLRKFLQQWDYERRKAGTCQEAGRHSVMYQTKSFCDDSGQI